MDYAAIAAAALSGAAWKAGSLAIRAIKNQAAASADHTARLARIELAVGNLPCHPLNGKPACPDTRDTAPRP